MVEKPESKWYLYVLECSDGTYYTGISNDIPRRVAMHNAGTASRYTRARRPVKIIHRKRCRSRSDALKKEYALKQLTREEKEGYLEKHGKIHHKQIQK